VKKAPLGTRLRRAIASFKREIFPEQAALVTNPMGNRFFLDWIMRSVNADEEVRRSARRLRARARDLRDTAPYVEQALSLLSNNVIGPWGPTISPQVKLPNGELDEKTNALIKDTWQRFAESRVTTDGKMNLVEYMHVAFQNHVNDGELFTRRWVGFKNDWSYGLEPIDPDQIDESMNVPGTSADSRVVMGIELDRWRRPLAYHVFDDTSVVYGGQKPERQRIPADQVLHNFRMRRLNQTRAVTWLLPVLVSLKMDASYTEAELMAACIGAAKMGFFRTTDAVNAGEIGEETKQGGFTMEVEPGIFGKLPPGWTVEPFDTDHPNAGFSAFQRQIGRKIAVGIGLSYPSLTGDLESVNYSSMRGGKLDERDFYLRLQEYWVQHFLNPIYREWLRISLLTGKLSLGTYDPTPFTECQWICRGWTWVDPLKDIQAAALAIENGLDSRTRILEEQGLDVKKVFAQLKAEQDLAAQYELSIAGASVADAVAKQNAQDQKDEEGIQNGRGRLARRLPGEYTVANGNGH